MEFIGLPAYFLAAALAGLIIAKPWGRRLAVVAVMGFALLYGSPLLVRWAREGGVHPWRSATEVHVGIIGAYALSIALIPAGLLRPFGERKWAPFAAFALALIWPFLCLAVVGVFGDRGSSVGSGWGFLGDLLFLDPVKLGHGVRYDGLITHKFRVHCLALGGWVLIGLALQFLPQRSMPSAARDRETGRSFVTPAR